MFAGRSVMTMSGSTCWLSLVKLLILQELLNVAFISRLHGTCPQPVCEACAAPLHKGLKAGRNSA